jgi:hypothetical protein
MGAKKKLLNPNKFNVEFTACDHSIDIVLESRRHGKRIVFEWRLRFESP